MIKTEAGNVTVGRGERHGDEDVNDAGSEISLLPMKDKGNHAEGLFLHLDRPCGGVPVASEIMMGQAKVGGRRSYRGYLGCNPRGGLDFTGRTENTVESGDARGGPGHNITPSHRDRQRQQNRG